MIGDVLMCMKVLGWHVGNPREIKKNEMLHVTTLKVPVSPVLPILPPHPRTGYVLFLPGKRASELSPSIEHRCRAYLKLGWRTVDGRLWAKTGLKFAQAILSPIIQWTPEYKRHKRSLSYRPCYHH